MTESLDALQLAADLGSLAQAWQAFEVSVGDTDLSPSRAERQPPDHPPEDER